MVVAEGSEPSDPLLVGNGLRAGRARSGRRRLFLAVHPPAGILSELGDLLRLDPAVWRRVEPASWHVTVRYLGGVEPEEVDSCLAGCVLPRVAAELGSRPEPLGGNVLVVRVAGVDALAGVVDDLVRSRFGPRDRPFVGHLTVGRRLRSAPEVVEEASPWAGIRGGEGDRYRCGFGEEGVRWEFAPRELALMASVPGEPRARYERLTGWELGGGTRKSSRNT